ncbi:MAG: porin family protein [Melioribacteraceae bacterium]|nr:porin family protein [Melioribacteraceae bacterium]
MKKTILILLLSAAALSAQEGEYGFTINGSLNFPGGDFDDYYNASFGGSGGIFYNFSETGRVSATIGYNAWSLDLDALNEDVKKSENPGSYNIEAPINAIPFLINVKFFLKTETSVTPYLLLEGGVYNITREVYGKYINEDGVSNKVTPRSDKTFDGSLNLGLGIEYPINELINLDINARYHYLLNKDTYNLGDAGYGYSYSTINFISISAGLNIFFK